jgi:hypothetical protein
VVAAGGCAAMRQRAYFQPPHNQPNHQPTQPPNHSSNRHPPQMYGLLAEVERHTYPSTSWSVDRLLEFMVTGEALQYT